jgi:hypothetical protein
LPKSTILAQGHINLSDEITITLVEPDNEPALVTDQPPRIVIEWPPHSSVTVPRKYNDVAAATMKILAAASTELARIKAGKYL